MMALSETKRTNSCKPTWTEVRLVKTGEQKHSAAMFKILNKTSPLNLGSNVGFFSQCCKILVLAKLPS